MAATSLPIAILLALPLGAGTASPGAQQQPDDPIAGVWYDALGEAWTVERVAHATDNGAWYRLLHGIRNRPPRDAPNAPPRAPAFLDRVAPGRLEKGMFLCTHHSWPEAMDYAPPPVLYRVDTTPKEALVVSIGISSWDDTRPADPAAIPRAFELTRDRDLLAREPPAERRPMEALEEALRSPDWTVRREAIRELPGHPGPAPAAALARSLDDEFRINKCLAARGLGRLGDPASIPALAAGMASGDACLARVAWEAWKGFDPRAGEGLLDFLGGRRALPAIRASPAGDPLPADARAFHAPLADLLATRGPEALPLLERAIRTGDPELVERVLDDDRFVARWRGARAAAAIAELLQDPDPATQAGAARALARVTPDLPAVREAIAAGRPDAAARLLASDEFLARFKGPGLEALLLELLSGKEDVRKPAALDALRRAGPWGAPAAPVLAEAARSAESQVWEPALRLLGEMGESAAAAVPALVDLLGDREKGGAAAAALDGIPAPEDALAAAFRRFLSTRGREARYEVVSMLGRSRFRFARSGILLALDDPDKDVRSQALVALQALAGPIPREAIPALRRALRGGDRESAAGVLCRMGPAAEELLPDLIEVLGEKEDGAYPLERNGYFLIEAAGGIGPAAKGAVPALVGLLEDRNLGVQEFAARALGRIGRTDHPAVPALRRVLDQDDGGAHAARAEAARALGLLADATPELVERLAELAAGGMQRDHDLTDAFYAAEALGNLGPGARDALPALETLFAAEPWLRVYALEAHGRISGNWDRAVRDLVPLLAHEWIDVRERAVEALGRAGRAARPALPALRMRLGDSQGSVAEAAGEAIRRIEGEAK